MTSELKAAAIVAIHGNDDAAFVELAPAVKPMSEGDLVGEAKSLFKNDADAYNAFMLAKRYAASQRGM